MLEKNQEVWVPIPDYEDIYQVSNHGRIRRVRKTWNGTQLRVLAGSRNSDGYIGIFLYRDGKAKHKYVHRLVAEHFLPHQLRANTVNHKDGIKNNNHVENLEFATYSQNNSHAYRMGIKVSTNRKLNEQDVRNIVSLWPSVSYQGLANMYGVGLGTIAQLFHGRTWRHITGFENRSKKEKADASKPASRR